MPIDDYYSYKDQVLTFTRCGASEFAKKIARDFNPIHDPEARRFCVPGDLLFAVVLDLHKASSRMEFAFQNMVDDQTALSLQSGDSLVSLTDNQGKIFLQVNVCGEKLQSEAGNRALIDAYVKFSGTTFPFLLVDLMRRHKVMINPQRPLVLYKSMLLELNDLDCDSFELSFTESSLIAEGKKAEVAFYFNIMNGDRIVGSGRKNMLLGGLREYQQSAVDIMVTEYNGIKARYVS